MKIIDAHAHIVQVIAGFGSQGELRAQGRGKAVHASGQVIDIIPPELGEIDVTPEKVIELMDAHDVERTATYDPFCVNLDKVRTHLFDESGFRIVKFEVSNGSGLTSYHPPVPLDGEIMDEAYAYHAARGDIFVIDIGR